MPQSKADRLIWKKAVSNDLKAYQGYRNSMRTGDLLQWKGNSPFDEVVMAYTGEDRSHTSIVIRLDHYPERVFSIEALSSGLHLWPLSLLLMDYDGMVEVNPIKDSYHHRNGPQADAVRFLLSKLGTKYDWPDVIGRWKTFIGREPDPIEISKLYCSEAVFAAFKVRYQDPVTSQWVGAGIPSLAQIEIPPVPGKPMIDLGIWESKAKVLVSRRS
jgi:hypothetical protein